MIFCLLMLDQLTKLAVLNKIPLNQNLWLIPGWLALAQARNPGGLFGYLHSAPGLGSPLFVLVPSLAIAWTGWCRRRGPSWGLTLAVAGLLGNLIDRVRLGFVVDFIAIRGLPAFDLADLWLMLAIVMLLRDSGTLATEISAKS